jgi:hypothetical protein
MPHPESMGTDKNSLQALKNLISETDLLISTTDPLPENRTPRCRELLRVALVLTDDLISQAKMPAAVRMGHKGGSTTARKYGSEHFRQLAAQRKTRAGGRPRKQAK